ncbi:MAG: hypothetical protein U1F11_06270 [Steroidobacteraceae bacterium]
MELRSEIRSFIEKNYLLGQSNGFADDASLLEHQVMDSTGVLELVSFLESQYGVLVADEELVPENLDSIELIAQFVLRKRAA